jgi:hypothetical protein
MLTLRAFVSIAGLSALLSLLSYRKRSLLARQPVFVELVLGARAVHGVWRSAHQIYMFVNFHSLPLPGN